MKRQAGLWIDHREAIVVFLGDNAEESKRIESGVEKHVRFSGGNESEEGSADDQRDRQFAVHLNRYYDEVIATLGDVVSILLFGPGEAKGELEKRMAAKGLGGRIVAIETVDKMTTPQITRKFASIFGNRTITEPHAPGILASTRQSPPDCWFRSWARATTKRTREPWKALRAFELSRPQQCPSRPSSSLPPFRRFSMQSRWSCMSPTWRPTNCCS